MALRSAMISICAAPEICSTFTSSAPRMPPMIDAILSACGFSTSRSGPNTLTARSLLTPEISSLTRSAMGCENDRRTPGITARSALMASTNSSLVRPVFHSFSGCSMMTRSFCSGPIGSSEISARPVFVTTVSTSGNLSRRCSMTVPTATDPSSEADGRRTTLMASDPSSSCGRNSVPRRGTRNIVAANSATARITVTHRNRSASDRRGL